MKKTSRWILQFGLAITFIVIGYLIIKDPLAFGSLMQPWAMKLVPGSLAGFMSQTGYLDIVIGILFIFRPTAWIAGIVGAIHLIIVLIATGTPALNITIRDVGLLAACVAITIETTPDIVWRKVMFWRS